MARGYEVAVGADGRAFNQALKKDIIKPTEDAAKALDELGAAAQDAGDGGARDIGKLESAIKEAERQTDKLDRSMGHVDKSVDKVGTTGKTGFRKAGVASAEFKSEALANISEVSSSFDGSLSSLADVAQGTFGGVAASIPGIGLAAGAAALGIGAITEEMNRAAERSAEIKTSIIQDFLELGSALDAEAVQARARDILGVEETRKQATLLAEIMDVTVGQAALAMAGDFEAAGVTIEDTREAIFNAPSTVDLADWQHLKEHMDATVEGFKLGEQAAKDLEDANHRKAASDRDAMAALDGHRKSLAGIHEDVKELHDKTITVKVRDHATAEVDRIVRRINGRVASITVNGKYGGRTAV